LELLTPVFGKPAIGLTDLARAIANFSAKRTDMFAMPDWQILFRVGGAYLAWAGDQNLSASDRQKNCARPARGTRKVWTCGTRKPNGAELENDEREEAQIATANIAKCDLALRGARQRAAKVTPERWQQVKHALDEAIRAGCCEPPPLSGTHRLHDPELGSEVETL